MLQIVLSDAAADQHGLSQALKDFGIPILVALLTSLFTLVVLGRQLRSGHFSQRYDAFRNKRAVAKALLGRSLCCAASWNWKQTRPFRLRNLFSIRQTYLRSVAYQAYAFYRPYRFMPTTRPSSRLAAQAG